MTNDEKLERKIDRLEENAKQSEALNGALGKALMDVIHKPFVNRRKIRKMYKNDGYDISRTVELYFQNK